MGIALTLLRGELFWSKHMLFILASMVGITGIALIGSFGAFVVHRSVDQQASEFPHRPASGNLSLVFRENLQL